MVSLRVRGDSIPGAVFICGTTIYCGVAYDSLNHHQVNDRSRKEPQRQHEVLTCRHDCRGRAAGGTPMQQANSGDRVV